MNKNISFFIKKSHQDKKGFVPIIGQVTINSKNYSFSIDKIKPRYWNKSKQRVNKQREDEPDNKHEEINNTIENLLKNTARFNHFDYYKVLPERKEVEKIFFDISPQTKTFFEAYNEFIESNKDKVTYNTSRNRKTVMNFFKRYENYSGNKISFKDINYSFYEKIYDFACNIIELEDNTFASHIAKFKSFLEWCIVKGYYNSYEHKKFTFTEKDKPVIHLTLDELKRLYNYDFGNSRLEKARDLYCFGCYTGLRFSDIASLRYEHIQGNYIHKVINKTKKETSIPILPQAMAILDKYKCDESIYPLPRLSNVKLNKYIKEACEIVGINEMTKKLIYRGNKVQEVFLEKYKLITVHTARKTFITIGFMLGMDVKTIKSITGHKKDATFDKYLKIAEELKKDKLFNAWKNA